MKALHLVGTSAVIFAAMIFAPTQAGAQSRGVGGGFRHLPAPPVANGPFLGFPGVYIVEREVVHVIEREVVHEDPPPPPEPPPPPRKPYKIGASYSSLPTPCMKMIQDGASYYHCSGEWYRQVGSGSAVEYKAVATP
jgi:hypothetical protein